MMHFGLQCHSWLLSRGDLGWLPGWLGPGRLIWRSDWRVLKPAAFSQGLHEWTAAVLKPLSGDAPAAILHRNTASFHGATA